MRSRQARQQYYRQRKGAPMRPRSRTMGKSRLLVAFGMAVFALLSYYGKGEVNEVTGEKQYIGLTQHQEIALGLQAMPEMMSQFGGELADPQAQKYVDEIGSRLVVHSAARQTDWQFEFHLLADPSTLNAFALPGGQVFITAGLYTKLATPAELAGVLGHEIGHVLARHGAQRMAKQNLTQGLIGSVVMGTGNQNAAQVAQAIGNMVNMKYGREDELESDYIGVSIMTEAGFNPHALKGVMEILAQGSSGARQAEFFSTHPNPENRIEKIQYAIETLYPQGLPNGLID